MKYPHVKQATAFIKGPGFTLTEIVLAMGIIASALMAVLAVLPAGLDVSRSAMDHSVVATIQEDVYHRLQGEELKVGMVSFSPAYFDALGVLIPNNAPPAELVSRRVYRADITITDWASLPIHTSSLKAATITLSWPLNGVGEGLGPENPRTTTTFAVTTNSGPDWKLIDVQYEPKIGQ